MKPHILLYNKLLKLKQSFFIFYFNVQETRVLSFLKLNILLSINKKRHYIEFLIFYNNSQTTITPFKSFMASAGTSACIFKPKFQRYCIFRLVWGERPTPLYNGVINVCHLLVLCRNYKKRQNFTKISNSWSFNL